MRLGSVVPDGVGGTEFHKDISLQTIVAYVQENFLTLFITLLVNIQGIICLSCSSKSSTLPYYSL